MCDNQNQRERFKILLDRNKHLLQEGYDVLKGHEAHIRMKDSAKPVFCKPRRMQYALHPAVEAELQKLGATV